MHDVINMAGAKHIGPGTSPAVIACLRGSSFWNCVCINGFYNGIGNGIASLCSPSYKGLRWYINYFKKARDDYEI